MQDADPGGCSQECSRSQSRLPRVTAARHHQLTSPQRGRTCLLQSCRAVPANARAAPLDRMVWEPAQLVWVGVSGLGYRVLHLMELPAEHSAPADAPFTVAASSWLLEHEQQKPWLAGMRAPLWSTAQPQVGLTEVGWSLQAVMVLPPVLTTSCAHMVESSLSLLEPGAGLYVPLVRAPMNAGTSRWCMSGFRGRSAGSLTMLQHWCLPLTMSCMFSAEVFQLCF